jgi:hypothetical protein
VTSSAAIEGVHLSREALEILRNETLIPKLTNGKPSKINANSHSFPRRKLENIRY